MATTSMFTHLKQAGKLLEVPMDGVDIVLPQSDKFSIGTRGLNGCTCVVILGDAIILAHISPFPGNFSRLPTDIPQASRDHHSDFLKRIHTLHATHRKHFPPKTTAWGIFSTDEHGSMKPVENQARAALKAMGHDMRLEKYQEIDVQLWKQPKGELVAVMKGKERLLFLERRQLWPEHKQAPATQQAAPTAWWFENKKYTYYRGGVALTTQTGVPPRVRFYNPTNKTVCYTDDPKKKPSSVPLSKIMTGDIGWKLEREDYVFYNKEGAEVNRQKVIPTLVGISDAANKRTILHDGKGLHVVKTQPPAKDAGDDHDDDDGGEDDDDDEEGDDDGEDDGVDDDNSDDDDDDNNDGDDDDDDDVIPNSPAQGSTSGSSGSQTFRWERLDDGLYVKKDRNGNIVHRQSKTPINEVFTQGGRHFCYDGKNNFVSINGQWQKMPSK